MKAIEGGGLVRLGGEIAVNGDTNILSGGFVRNRLQQFMESLADKRVAVIFLRL